MGSSDRGAEVEHSQDAQRSWVLLADLVLQPFGGRFAEIDRFIKPADGQ